MECSILAQENVKLTDDERFINSYDLILPLRILSLRSKPKQWKPFWKMMSHLKAFKQNKEWMEKQKNVLDFILKKLKIPDVSEELLLTILAIDSVNGRTGNSKVYFSTYLGFQGIFTTHPGPNHFQYQ